MSDSGSAQPGSTTRSPSTGGRAAGHATVQPPPNLSAKLKGLWRVEIALRIQDLRDRLSVARATGGATAKDLASVRWCKETAVTVEFRKNTKVASQAHTAVWESHFNAAEKALCLAECATEVSGIWSYPVRIKEWWTGCRVTEAWESVHNAEAELVDIGSDADVSASLPGLWSWMQQAMTEAERATYKSKMEAMLSGKDALDRNLIRQAYRDVIRANNDMHTRMRSFRNTLFLVSFLLLGLLLVAGIWHDRNVHVLSFCTGTGASVACLGGTSSPRWIVLAIELVGALAGLLSGAVLIGNFKQAPSRYNLLPGQLALKPAAGAAAAVLAILFLQSGLIAKPSGDASKIEVALGYAALFGFSQQLLTRFVDKRASEIVKNQEEGKEEAVEAKV